MRLSRYYTLARLIHSDTARAERIDNSPPPEIVANLRLLARGLDRVRLLLGHPLEISSAYRCEALNRAVGGAPRSQHAQGLAADFVCPGFGPPFQVARAIRDSSIAFDQCILEYDRWVHLSFTAAPRRRVLTLHDGAEGYVDGLVEARRQA